MVVEGPEEKFLGNWNPKTIQKSVVAPPESVHGGVAARIPSLGRRQCAGVRSDECGDGKHSAAASSSRSQIGDERMTQAWEYAAALATVVGHVLTKEFRESVASVRLNRGLAEARADAAAVAGCALAPFRRSVFGLTNGSAESGAQKGVGAKRIEQILLDTLLERRDRIFVCGCRSLRRLRRSERARSGRGKGRVLSLGAKLSERQKSDEHEQENLRRLHKGSQHNIQSRASLGKFPRGWLTRIVVSHRLARLARRENLWLR